MERIVAYAVPVAVTYFAVRFCPGVLGAEPLGVEFGASVALTFVAADPKHLRLKTSRTQGPRNNASAGASESVRMPPALE
jgi:hypothetical protein